MKKAQLLVLVCFITGFGAYAAVQVPAGVALRYVTAAEAFTLVKQQLGADATGAVSSVDEKRNLIALDAVHAQAPIVRAFLTGLDNPPPEVRVDTTITQKSPATATATNQPFLSQFFPVRFRVLNITRHGDPANGKQTTVLRLTPYYGRIDRKSQDFRLKHDTQDLTLVTLIDVGYEIRTNDIIGFQAYQHLKAE